MSLTSSLFQSYGFSSNIAEGIEVIYSYNQINPIVEYIDFLYAYNDPNDDEDFVAIPYGYKVAATQQILNNLPLWMEGRKNYDSNMNKLTTAWADTFESTLDNYSYLRKNQFLATADLYSNIELGVSALSANKDRVYTPVFNNLIYNSSFSMKGPAREQRPSGWLISRDSINCLTFDSANTLFGNHGLSLSGKVELKQTRERQLTPGPITYSIYYKTLDNGLPTDDYWSANEAGLILAIEYADSTVATFGVGFLKNTKGRWARANLTATMVSETFKISTLILNRVSYVYSVDCPLLTTSKTLDTWSPSIEDIPVYSSGIRTIAGLQVLFDSLDFASVSKLEVLPTATEQEFKSIAIPTRIETFSPSQQAANSLSFTMGRQLNFHGDIMPTMLIADQDTILEESINTPDKFSRRRPADLILTYTGDKYLYKKSINEDTSLVKATCVVNDLLYVVTKETYAGVTGHYLKVTRPRVVSYTDDYIPSYGDIKIPLSLGNEFGFASLAEEIVRIGICKNLPNVIYVDTSLDRRFYFKLYFDYYFADFTNRKIYCRENYSEQFGHLQVI